MKIQQQLVEQCTAAQKIDSKFQRMFKVFREPQFIADLNIISFTYTGDAQQNIVESLCVFPVSRSPSDIGSQHTGNGEIKEIVEQLGTAAYSVPKAVYAISITEETLAGMTGFSDMAGASEALKDFLMQKSLSALMTQITAMGGVENLAAASVCTAGKTFISENAAGNIIYLYTYDNAVPAAVTFTVGEEHTVSANGVFMLYDGFTCDSADEIKSFFSDISVEVTEVFPEK